MQEDYVLSELAEQDINEIITYIAADSIQAAYKFIDLLYDAMSKLSENPKLGHVRKDLTDKPVKFWTFKWHYLIVYKDVQPLEIVRVLSGHRDILSIL